MKGLLLKDFYIIKSLLIMMLAVFIVVGSGLAFLASPYVLIVLAAIMLGMIAATTINVDKASGWTRLSATLPVSRQAVISSKYLMYVLLSTAGLTLGTLLSLIVSSILHEIDMENIFLFISISITICLLSGSIMLPAYFILDEEKSILGTIISYPLASGIFIIMALLFDNMLLLSITSISASLILFLISWALSCRLITKRDI